MKKICFVLDRSGSMQGIKLDSAKEGIRRFVEGLYTHRDSDMLTYVDTYISFISFNDIVQVRLTRRPVTAVIPKLKHALGRTTARGMSALWDALGTAVRELSEGNRSTDENWIVLLTDGRDNSSRRFDLKRLREYVKGAGIIVHIMVIGLGDSVEELKLKTLTAGSRGQYIRSAEDSVSIRSSFAQVEKSINTVEYSPSIEIDAKRNRYGDLLPEDLARRGIKMEIPPDAPAEKDETDIFKMSVIRLRMDTQDAELRRKNAMAEECDHETSAVGKPGGMEISGVINTQTHLVQYCKHKKDAPGEIEGACTCDDFRHRGSRDGIPCKHLWLVIGTDAEKVCEVDSVRNDIESVLSGLDGEQLGLDADQTARIIELMQNKLAPLLANAGNNRRKAVASSRPQTPASTPGSFESLVMEGLRKTPGGADLDRLCRIMGVKTSKGKKKVLIVLKFLEKKGSILFREDRWRIL